MKIVEQSYQGSTISLGQRVRTGVLLAMIRMVKMMMGAGVWQVLGGRVTGGVPQAQVGMAMTKLSHFFFF